MADDGLQGFALEVLVVHWQGNATVRIVPVFEDVVAAGGVVNKTQLAQAPEGLFWGLASRDAGHLLLEGDADLFFDRLQCDLTASLIF